MQSLRIYSDFSAEIAWIRQEVASDVSSLPPSLKPLARFYTRERLRVLPGRSGLPSFDPKMGKPVPYAAFWFADALGLTDRKRKRLSGLSLVYSSLATTLKDDIEDSSDGDDDDKVRLAEFWFQKYQATLGAVFPTDAGFRNSASWADSEWSRYRAWNLAPMGKERLQPFSEGFLGESSRYFVAVVLPTLNAVASASGEERQAPRIGAFLRSFSMGWRVFDDLMDWERDLAAKEMNRSSVLHYIQNRTGSGTTLDRTTVLSWFMSGEFVDDAYGAMLGFFAEAQKVAAGFGSRYLDVFMEEMVSFHTRKREAMLKSAGSILSVLRGFFLKTAP